MKISEHANYLLNEYGRLQFDYAAYYKPYGESLRNEARNNLEEYIAELEADSVQIQYICEDELPETISDEVYSAMYPCSNVHFVRMFPFVMVDGDKCFLIYLPEVQE